MKSIRSVALACAIASAPLGVFAEEGHHDWDYGAEHGPRHWGELKPEFAACGVGKNQSPIDIRDAVASDLPAIRFDYHATPLRVIDNGHTVQVNYGSGSAITVDGHRYELVQFHFHQPSEERINGERYPMVAHLVHKDAAGALAVVAVLLKAGKPNDLVQALWKHLPAEKEKEAVLETVGIDAVALLPSSRGYYTFTGSLTTPPCSEGVAWFVLANPVEVSKAQIARFGKVYSGNARPVQPLNGRVVKVSR